MNKFEEHLINVLLEEENKKKSKPRSDYPARPARPRDFRTSPRLKLSNLIDLPLPKARPVGKNPDNLQQGNTNKSQNNPGHEERMKAHQARIDAKVKLDRKMGRDVNEGRWDR
jgi:hypothetical protein